ncbi:LOW QUALITY PROTEIN: kinesin-like protein KIF28P [Amphiura filiformis]|uniref:LOW QUALITY PROTEIN: kinesin-like protein KIF28P n=1 Tax=Amphiura filiformis TaxID=82378 RepID=UPI003B21FF09
MKGTTTYITDPSAPKDDPKEFNFDYSYWSHDGFKEEGNGMLVPTETKYADQSTVFKDLGQGVLDNAWSGYNSTLFAYGQTGSGKSFSMVGYGVNRGIVPIFCDELFVGINKQKDSGSKTEFEVSFSMLEIYNEAVRDLLNPNSAKGSKGLRVREHPKKGFYVDQLKSVPVQSYAEIEDRMEEGTRNRTVAATQMNATSSRAHTIVGITFTQKSINDAGQEMAKTAICNLVDLAGSERADSTGATGQRLKEGIGINQSLSSLGNCIAALADQAGGKKTKVPFRDSVLTKLLKNALGGNSKTVMIAALSPADINFDETLSTLRYADRAKQIKTQAVVNEDPTEKLIRELKEENQRLLDAIKKGGVVTIGAGGASEEDMKNMSEAEKAAMRKEMEEEMEARVKDTEREMEEMKRTWEEKLKQAQEAGGGGGKSTKEARKTKPHFYNLNIDTQLSGMIAHLVGPGTYKIGNNKADTTPDIELNGLSIQKEHAIVTNDGGKVFIEKACAEAKLLVNGDSVMNKQELDHNDRVMFGSNHLYVFYHPDLYKANPKNYTQIITYEMAQGEIAAQSGFDMSAKHSNDELLLQEDLVEMIPALEEANAISEELDKKVKFEIVVMSAKARGLASGRTEVCVKMRNLENSLEYIWPRNRFIRRKYLMQEMYQNFAEGADWQLPDEQDPFTEDADTEVQIGVVNCYLQSLAYLIESREQLEITDYRNKEVGLLSVEIVPCDKSGREFTDADDIFVEDPKELIGTPVNFVVKVNSATGIPNKYTDIYCKYNMFLDTEPSKTGVIKGTSNPEFKHRKFYNYDVTTSQLVDYMNNGVLMIQIWGKQKMLQATKKVKLQNTKQINLAEVVAKGNNQNQDSGKTVDVDKVRLTFQLTVAKKRQERLDAKVAQFKKMLEVAERHNKARIETTVIKQVMMAPNMKVAEKAIARIPKDSGAGDMGPHANGNQKSGVCNIM